MEEIEKEYQEMLDEVYGNDYARLLKNGDPIDYEIGLNEYERENVK